MEGCIIFTAQKCTLAATVKGPLKSTIRHVCFGCKLAQWVRTENDTNSVYFSLILSGGEYGFRSWDAIPAINIALEAIKDNQLLPAYNFAYKDERNSKVKGTVLLCMI